MTMPLAAGKKFDSLKIVLKKLVKCAMNKKYIPLLVQKSTEVANAIRYEASTFIVAYLQLLTDIFQRTATRIYAICKFLRTRCLE